MNPLPTAAGKNTSAAPGHNGMNFKQIVQNVCLFNPGFRRHPLVQKYSRLRCPLWKFSSLYKAEALYEDRLKSYKAASVCVFVYFYRFFKLLGLKACQYNISIMIRIKLELN